MGAEVGRQARTIRIFLADGTPTGILTAEVMNWTGKVVVGPRSRLPQLVARVEAARTGLYILVGGDPEEAGRQKIYIGEADVVKERLVKHNNDVEKDFFSRIIIVVSKDENLTKAHARFLESQLILLAKKAAQAALANGTSPSFDLLPESDKADMEYFLEQIALILPVLGFGFLQELPTLAATLEAGKVPVEPQFEMNTVGVKAVALESDGQFVVLAGSTARLNGTSTWTSYKGLREKLLAEGKLVQSGEPNVLKFAEDVGFDSPSAAAAVVFAGNQNGRIAWRVKGTGQTYKDWQQQGVEEGSKASVIGSVQSEIG